MIAVRNLILIAEHQARYWLRRFSVARQEAEEPARERVSVKDTTCRADCAIGRAIGDGVQPLSQGGGYIPDLTIGLPDCSLAKFSRSASMSAGRP